MQKITFPLIIRKWRHGDFFYPLGMKQKKKLSDYFVDRKFSVLEKEKITVLESAGEIAWIVGERLDNRFRITDSTKKALIIKALGAGQWFQDAM
jgi:tRNA(Ile)-lysidine synthase